MTRARVLYLADIRFPLERANGIQSMQTCHALARRGHEVTLLVRPDTHQPPRDSFEFYGLPRIDGLRIELAPAVGPPAARRTGYLTYAIGRSLGRARQDLLFTRDLGVASLLLRIPASLRAPLVYEAHGIAADVAAALPELLGHTQRPSAAKLRRLTAREAAVWNGAQGYVTITRALATELERRFGTRARLAVVPDGVAAADIADDTERSATDVADGTERDPAKDATDHADETTSELPAPHLTPSASEPVFTIGYAGHLCPWKGVNLIIEAVAALTDVRALIVGGHEQEADLERVRRLALDLDCASRVTFTGLLPPSDVARCLQRADVLVLPNPPSAISREFTSPLKLFEYMATRRPIIASDLPAIREVLRDGENALLVEPGNPQALTAAVRRLREDAALGQRLAAQAAREVRDYTWDRRAERLENLFEQVIA